VGQLSPGWIVTKHLDDKVLKIDLDKVKNQDAGVVISDAGAKPADASTATPDAGATTPDASATTPDAGATPSKPDAAVVPSAKPDAGRLKGLPVIIPK